MALEDVLTAQEVVDRSNGTIDITDMRLAPYLSDALGQAALYAPCLQSDSLSDVKTIQAKAIVADAVLRRFSRDEQPQETGLAAETWTMGPMGRTLNFSDNTNAGLPLLTKADRDMLAAICTKRKASSIPVVLPTVNDPTQSGWPSGYRVG